MIAGDYVITTDYLGAEIVATDRTTGAEAWRQPMTINWSMWFRTERQAPIAVAMASRTIVTTEAEGLTFRSLDDGTVIARPSIPELQGALNNPVLVGNRIYVTEGHHRTDCSIVALEVTP